MLKIDIENHNRPLDGVIADLVFIEKNTIKIINESKVLDMDDSNLETLINIFVKDETIPYYISNIFSTIIEILELYTKTKDFSLTEGYVRSTELLYDRYYTIDDFNRNNYTTTELTVSKTVAHYNLRIVIGMLYMITGLNGIRLFNILLREMQYDN